jgi:hypothetical protein
MTLLRILKNKSSLYVAVFLCSAIFFLSALLPSPSSSSSKDSTTLANQQQDQRHVNSVNEYSRMKDENKRRLLYSALGHIRIGYVANRTPDVDTPPLLVMYSCKSTLMPCGGWGKRLLDIAHGYYFSMLVDGTAFTVDMSDPTPFQSYFEAVPGYMALQPSQAYYYIDQLDKKNENDKVRNMTMQTMTLDPATNYVDHYKQQPVRILQTTQWPLDSISTALQTSPSMKQLRDQYRLNEVTDVSQWFWLVNRLLFNPSDWLASQLAPHRLLMGGSISLGDSLSWMDSRNQIDATVAASWFRIGLRLPENDDSDETKCWMDHVERLCALSSKQCHLFVSAPTSRLLHHVKQYPATTIHTIHAVADSFAFTTIGHSPVDATKKPLFESEDQYLKSAFARPVMDWVILTRMDYLVGPQADDFIKTAAWAAQVQTDLLMDDTASCQFKPMVDW